MSLAEKSSQIALKSHRMVILLISSSLVFTYCSQTNFSQKPSVVNKMFSDVTMVSFACYQVLTWCTRKILTLGSNDIGLNPGFIFD